MIELRDKLIILHIAKIKNGLYDGVSVVVPQHIIHQSEYAMVGFLNVYNVKIEGVSNQFDFTKPFNINVLPVPFNKPDLVVFHEVYCSEYLKLSKNLRENSIPYIIIPHGELTNGAQKKKWLKKKVANFLLFNKYIKGATAIQCLSQNELSSTKFGKNKFVGTNGITLPDKRKQSFHTDKIRFTYIGRLDPYHKGLDLLIKTIALKKDILNENNCRFVIHGPDTFGRGDKIRNLIKGNNVENLVELRSEVSGSEKENILLDSDIFIQTSRFEGMPMGILEALSYGLPVLITEGTMLGGLVKDYNAGCVSETTVDSIGEILEKAIAEKALFAEKSGKAIELIKDNFEWSKVASSTIEKYKEIIEY